MRVTLGLHWCCLLTLLGGSLSPAYGQYDGSSSFHGITVMGTGEARAVPDVMEINLKLNARGELTDDAVVKHKDARKRTMETFQALKLENLHIEERDLGLRPGNMQEMYQMMWSGMPPAQNKRTPIEVGSTLRARLTGIDKMPVEDLMSTIGKLIDAAQDSGVALGMSDSDMMAMRYGYYRQQQSIVKFVVTNTTEMREKAYDLAVKDARRRAERLARLNGVKLGAVLFVNEVSSGSGRQRQPYYYYGWDAGDDADDDNLEVVADNMSGGKFTVLLSVRFAIAGDAAQADAAPPGGDVPVVAKEKSP